MSPLLRPVLLILLASTVGLAQEPKPAPKAKDDVARPQKIALPQEELTKAVVTVAGVVFDDADGDGQRSVGEKGLPGVWVSNGIDLKKTDADGKYSLSLPPAKTRTVFVVIPGDRELTDKFYVHVEPTQTKDTVADFGLRRRANSPASNMQFVQVTDVHASKAKDAVSISQDMEEINRLNGAIEFVVATGDLTNNATPAEYDNYIAGMNVSKRPVRHVIGNHDVDGKQTPYKTLIYERYCGPPYYAFEVGNTHFIALDSVNWTAGQQEWLKWHLGTVPPERTIVVFQHYPPRKELLDYLAQFNCKAIFSGHVHGTRINEYKGIFNCNSTTLIMGAIDRSPRGFQLVNVAGDKVRTVGFIGGSGRQWTQEAAEKRNGQPRLLPAAAGAASPAVKTGADWPMAHADAQSTGTARDAVAPPLTPAWSAYAGGIVHLGSTIVHDGRVYVGTLYVGDFDNCGVTCLDAVTGRPLWRTRTDGCIKNTPAAAGGRVYVVSLVGTVYCLDAKDGHVVWKQACGEPAVRWDISAPKIADGVVYVGTGNHFTALSAADGSFVWSKRYVTATVKTKGKEEYLERANVIHDDWWPSYYQSCAVGKDVVYLGGRTGLHTIERKTGHLLKTRTQVEKTKTRSGCLPVVYEDRLYAAFGRLLGFAADEAGAVTVQSEALIGDETGTPAIAQGTAVFGTSTGKVVAADVKTGRTLWQFQTGKAIATMLPYQRNESTVSSSPAISGGTVYIGGNDGVLYALELKTGRVLDRQNVGVPLCSSPCVSGNAVIIAGYDGVVRCWTGR
jgi:outer membrane protein assembly factor BamB